MDVSQIDTRQGTDNCFELSHGNIFPLTGFPWGSQYYSVETNDDTWWFRPASKHFRGIRLTHVPTVWAGKQGDYCSVLLEPFSSRTQGMTDVAYDPQQSAFHPQVLKVYEKEDALTATVVPSADGSLITVQAADAHLGFNLSFPNKGEFTQVEGKVIEGYSVQIGSYRTTPLKMYFHIEFSQPIAGTKTLDNGVLAVSLSESDQIEARIGTSFISPALAKAHTPKASQAELLQTITTVWNERLNRIEAEDQDAEKVSTFYHNMYRAFLYPMRLYELDKDDQPIHLNSYNDQVTPGYLYTNNGFWDTARTVYPLYSLIAQDELTKILGGYLNSYKESGYLPKWLSPEDGGGMAGNLIDGVIADAASKGIAKDLMPEFLEGMIHSATVPDPGKRVGRRYAADYNKLGYVPADDAESVNNSLDYSYSDYCISVVAQSLGKTDVAAKYREKAGQYRNLFDKKRGFMVAKDRDGNFKKDFSATSWGGAYTEGCAYQSTFAEPQDIQGLINLYGGDQPFLQTLVKLANTRPKYEVGGYGHVIHEMAEMEANEFGQINLGNQPSFHLPFLFAFVGKSYYAQPLLKQAMSRLFNDGVDGYPGDEDNGSMASFYIFNSLGIYPFCPGSGQYIFGIPTLDHAVVHLAGGKTLEVKTAQNFPQCQFVDAVKVNGETYQKSFVEHSDLMQGAKLDFTLGIAPNPDCFADPAKPFSLTSQG